MPQVWMKNTCTLISIRFPQGLKWQKARRLLLRLDKRGEDKETGERRREEEKRRNQRKEVEGRRKAFEQGLRKEIRAVDLFQPRITQIESQSQSQYHTKVEILFWFLKKEPKDGFAGTVEQ